LSFTSSPHFTERARKGRTGSIHYSLKLQAGL
jgi:hypothetical protein